MRSSDCGPGSRTTRAARRCSVTGRGTTTGSPAGCCRPRRRGCHRRSRSESACARACCSITSRARGWPPATSVSTRTARRRLAACSSASWMRSAGCSGWTPRAASIGACSMSCSCSKIEERELGMVGSAPAARPVTFASLADVQQALDDSEALLWYSLAPWEDVYGDFGGGAWLVSVTRAAARVHRLPSSVDLRSQVATLVGLLRDRDLPAERWAPAAAASVAHCSGQRSRSYRLASDGWSSSRTATCTPCRSRRLRPRAMCRGWVSGSTSRWCRRPRSGCACAGSR